eukprot:TRINITY_DN4021_c0_g1_i1.p1 TRINITY_DN4021_c0_g1~~TRINITY_DN4021_c0_g1_i1.p1  ORF type:complete len:365 (-),score=93.00 TRINITY_DN4021_c0_g1_i1:667-1761(-)
MAEPPQKRFKGAAAAASAAPSAYERDLQRAIKLSLQQLGMPSPEPGAAVAGASASAAPTTPRQQQRMAFGAGQQGAPYWFNKLKGFTHECNRSTISLQQIVPPPGGDGEDSITSCIMTTYELELEWLLSELPHLLQYQTPTILVHGQTYREQMESRVPPFIQLRKPDIKIPYGLQHSKLFLVFFKDKLRVAVSTANLISIDYNRKTQAVWVQDFPPKAARSTGGSSDTCEFEETLVDYVRRLELDTRPLRAFDFSLARGVLIPSVPGYHTGSLLNKYGHMRLRRALQNVVIPDAFKMSPVVCQFSSMGAINAKWLEELYTSFAACSTPAEVRPTITVARCWSDVSTRFAARVNIHAHTYLHTEG